MCVFEGWVTSLRVNSKSSTEVKTVIPPESFGVPMRVDQKAMNEVTMLVEFIKTDYYEDLVTILLKGDRNKYTWNPANSQIHCLVRVCPATIANGKLFHLWVNKDKGAKGFSPLDHSFFLPG